MRLDTDHTTTEDPSTAAGPVAYPTTFTAAQAGVNTTMTLTAGSGGVVPPTVTTSIGAADPPESTGAGRSTGPATVDPHQARLDRVRAAQANPTGLAVGVDDGPSLDDLAVEQPAGDPTPRRKIGIVGFTATRKDAPYDDPEWELWGLNNLWHFDDVITARFTAWFDLHDEGTVRDDPKHVEWLQAGADGLPVFMHHPQDDFPSAMLYPADDMMKRFAPYFTNSVSWMTALAIAVLEARAEHHGWDLTECEIGVWGIDMADSTEYGSQRPSCEYFLGVANGLGMGVYVAPASDLLKTAMQYGLENSPLIAKMRLLERDHEAQIANLQQHHTAKHNELAAYTEQKNAEIRYVEAQINGHTGALNTLKALLATWAPPGNHGKSTHESEPTT